MLKEVLRYNREIFIRNGGYNMYKYNVPDKVNKTALEVFNSVIEKEEERNPEKEALISAQTMFHNQLEEIKQQKVQALQSLDLKKASDLSQLIQNIEAKITEMEAKIEAQEKAKLNPDEDSVFEQLTKKTGIKEPEEEVDESNKVRKTEKLGKSDYDHEKLVESTYSFLKKIDYKTAEKLISQNSQLKKDLGTDFDTLIQRLKENVG